MTHWVDKGFLLGTLYIYIKDQAETLAYEFSDWIFNKHVYWVA